MNWRAFNALFLREVRRGRKLMIIFSVIAAGATALAFVVSKDASIGVSIMVAFTGIILVFAPLGDLRTDKTLGHLEFDRVLPISHRAMATARLCGAAVRTSPMMLCALPIVVTLDRGHPLDLVRIATGIAVPVFAWFLFTAFTWALMAVNIRWNLRKLWWVPMTIFVGPNILISALPDSTKDAIEVWLKRVGEPTMDFLATPVGLALLLAVLIGIPLLLFWIAISVFASGLERYTYDASGAVAVLGAPPKRELAAAGKGPALAVARYCIRLATEQSRKRLILLGVFVVILVVGSAEMKSYAKFYVRALAALFPAGIAMQLSVARARGNLEGIQQLPHPATTIGAGYLLGIAILSTPGAAVWVLARAVNGTPPTVSNVISLWAWMAGWSWLATVSVVWLTTRRMLMIAAVPVAIVASWVMYVGPDGFVASARTAAAGFAAFRVSAGMAFPLALAFAMMMGGLPLFARGLREYEFAAAKPEGWLSKWATRVRARRGLR